MNPRMGAALAALLCLALGCATLDVVCDRNGTDTIRGTMIGEASARCYEPATASGDVPAIPAPGDQATAPPADVSETDRHVTAEVKGGKLSSGGGLAIGVLARGAAGYMTGGLLC